MERDPRHEGSWRSAERFKLEREIFTKEKEMCNRKRFDRLVLREAFGNV
jgi:hypothetical protein